MDQNGLISFYQYLHRNNIIYYAGYFQEEVVGWTILLYTVSDIPIILPFDYGDRISGYERSDNFPTLGGDGGSIPYMFEQYNTVCNSKLSTAKSAGNAILAVPNSKDVEWGGSIIKEANGAFGLSGNQSASNSQEGTGNILTDRSDISAVVGSIHNHPANRAGGNLDGDRYPSDLDWDAAANFVSQYRLNAADFTIYVLDGRGEVRGFQLSDRIKYPHDNQFDARKRGDGLPGALPAPTGCAN